MLGVIWKWKKRKKRYTGDAESAVMKTRTTTSFKRMRSGSMVEVLQLRKL